jgi:2-C-methyl-D-erythritol 4-phosphate cytidylyltransferase
MTTAIVLAAGSSTRFGRDKMKVRVCGVYPWQIIEGQLLGLVKSVIVVGIDLKGGSSRAESVKAGLEFVDTDRVLIVDAARFLVRAHDFKAVLAQTEDAVSFGRPLVNTVIHVLGTGHEKEFGYELHTPQAFNTEALNRAIEYHEKTGDFPYSNEFSLMCRDPALTTKIIPGSWRTGLKLTNPEDLSLMKASWGMI